MRAVWINFLAGVIEIDFRFGLSCGRLIDDLQICGLGGNLQVTGAPSLSPPVAIDIDDVIVDDDRRDDHVGPQFPLTFGKQAHVDQQPALDSPVHPCPRSAARVAELRAVDLQAPCCRDRRRSDPYFRKPDVPSD